MGDSINRGPPRQTSTYNNFTYRQEFLISGIPIEHLSILAYIHIYIYAHPLDTPRITLYALIF